jgi:hypothetical protein
LATFFDPSKTARRESPDRIITPNKSFPAPNATTTCGRAARVVDVGIRRVERSRINRIPTLLRCPAHAGRFPWAPHQFHLHHGTLRIFADRSCWADLLSLDTLRTDNDHAPIRSLSGSQTRVITAAPAHQNRPDQELLNPGAIAICDFRKQAGGCPPTVDLESSNGQHSYREKKSLDR